MVDPFLVAVNEDDDGTLEPVSLREKIRVGRPHLPGDCRRGGALCLTPISIATTISTARCWPTGSRSSATRCARRLAGELTEDQFKPLRLMNGLYLQLHAYMLRIAIPYGTLSIDASCASSREIARTYDRGYGHFTTRQNLQFHWIKLEDAPDILDELAEVDMHAIQTSGNCIRNVTADPFAGAAADEIDDPRVWAEIDPPVVDLPSGVQLPAAQVQDRRHRLAERPRRACASTTSACGCDATPRASSASR